jgi:hypothetical protein
MTSIANRITSGDSLPRLVQADNFIGWVYQIDYENAFVMTNDLWKARVSGVPHNSFLLASSFRPDTYSTANPIEREVILLRVIGSSKLPMDDDLVNMKIEHFQEREDNRPESASLDDLSRNQLQFNGLQCRVLGTFYTNGDGRLCLGSDLETYHSATQLQVFKPRSEALASIVNYISPIRESAAEEEAERLGVEGTMPDFPIGAVRFTSSNRLQRIDPEVVFRVQSIDFLARRTAVFGMTRTGKSNMIKQLVSVVKRTADDTGLRIGQIIYDLNGEYANANQQDAGALADVYPCDTERYRMLPARGFHLIQNNFYLQVEEGFAVIKGILGDQHSPSADLKSFLSVSFERPREEDRGQFNRWQLRCAIYQAILHRANFPLPNGFQISFLANRDVRERVDPDEDFPNADRRGMLRLTADQAVQWFTKAREANREQTLRSSSGEEWIDQDSKVLLNILDQKNDNNSFITGYKHLTHLRGFHSPDRTQDVSEEIYQHLVQGKIVILDLSVGDPNQRTRLSKVIARHIFKRSMETFNEGEFPPNIMIYVEEAHNIMGRKDDLTDTWPRIAKEGAKFRIGTVYATQEVSSMHPNILSNTENMFVSHLNNEGELRELSKFYDYRDFATSLIRAQDVGFARVKTLSSPFVIPVQIHRFDPEQERQRAAGSSPSTEE